MRVKRMCAFAAIYLLWGGSYLAIRLVVQTVPPMVAASLRYGISGMILLAISLGLKREALPDAKEIFNCMLSGVMMIVVGYAVVFWAATRMPSWEIAIIVSTSFLWTYLGECIVLRSERLKVQVLFYLMLGLVGIPIVAKSAIGHSQLIPGAAIAAVLASTFAWSAGTLALKKMRFAKSYLQTAGIQLASAGLILGGISLVLGEWSLLAIQNIVIVPKAILGMTYLIVGGSVAAFGAFHWLMQRESPSLVATFAYVNPVVAMILGIYFAHEEWSLLQLTGAAAIVLSVVLVWQAKARAISDDRLTAEEVAPSIPAVAFDS